MLVYARFLVLVVTLLMVLSITSMAASAEAPSANEDDDYFVSLDNADDLDAISKTRFLWLVQYHNGAVQNREKLNRLAAVFEDTLHLGEVDCSVAFELCTDLVITDATPRLRLFNFGPDTFRADVPIEMNDRIFELQNLILEMLPLPNIPVVKTRSDVGVLVSRPVHRRLYLSRPVTKQAKLDNPVTISTTLFRALCHLFSLDVECVLVEADAAITKPLYVSQLGLTYVTQPNLMESTGAVVGHRALNSLGAGEINPMPLFYDLMQWVGHVGGVVLSPGYGEVSPHVQDRDVDGIAYTEDEYEDMLLHGQNVKASWLRSFAPPSGGNRHPPRHGPDDGPAEGWAVPPHDDP
eukprot:PhM_4_TR7322/c0_g1_i1/m.958